MSRHAGFLIGGLLLSAPAVAQPAEDAADAVDVVDVVDVVDIDAGASQVEFDLRTRWGQTLRGRFPEHEGRVLKLPDGRYEVRLRLDVGAVEIAGQPRYTRLTRSEGFLDAGRHPVLEFVSNRFDPALLVSGGELGGEVEIRGVRRDERFVVKPAGCARPLMDCPVVVAGQLSRARYGMDRWEVALSDRIQLTLGLHGREPLAP